MVAVVVSGLYVSPTAEVSPERLDNDGHMTCMIT